MRRIFLLLVSVIFLAGMLYIGTPSTVLASGVTYYVDSVNGNDNNNGTSPAAAWRTLGKVNGSSFSPGDSILFKGGCFWSGSLIVPSSGNAANQIVFGSYGTGRAMIDGGNYARTVDISGKEYITVRDLEITNSHPNDWNTTLRCGIYADATSSGIAHNLIIDNCVIHNVDGVYSFYDIGNGITRFQNGAIYITYTGNNGYLSPDNHWDGITIQNCNIYDCSETGIQTNEGSAEVLIHPYNTNVVVRDTTISNNSSDGITLLFCDGPVVQNVLCYDAGRLTQDDSAICLVGIWAVASNDAVFRNCEVARTRYIQNDGTAFDLDWGEGGTFLHEYNYTHGNEGGFQDNCLFVGPGSPDFVKCVCRYNVSVDDGDYVIAHDVGDWDWEMYNNVFYRSSGSMGMGYLSQSVKYTNNIFYFQTSPNWGNCTYDNNCYYPIPANPNDAHAVTGDPKLVNPGVVGDGMSYAANYSIQAGSSCYNAGTLILDNGGKDFLGNAVSYGGAADIGAFELQSGPFGIPAMINDDNSGITYAGGYFYDSNSRGVGDYHDDVHASQTANTYFEYTFNGTGVDYITEKNSDQGNVDIYIDGVYQTTVNCYNAIRMAQQTVYSKTGMISGQHTIKGVKNSGQWLVLDALRIYRYAEDFSNGLNAWTQTTGTATVAVENGELSVASNGTGNVVIDNNSPNTADGIYTVTVKPDGYSRCGIALRYSSSTSYCVIAYNINNEWIWWNGSGQSGTVTTSGPSMAAGSTHILKVQYAGTTFTLWLDGSQFYNGTLSSMPVTAGKTGVINWNNAHTHFDNIRLE